MPTFISGDCRPFLIFLNFLKSRSLITSLYDSGSSSSTVVNKYLEDKILRDGRIINNNIIKVDNFLNHLINWEFVESCL